MVLLEWQKSFLFCQTNRIHAQVRGLSWTRETCRLKSNLNNSNHILSYTIVFFLVSYQNDDVKQARLILTNPLYFNINMLYLTTDLSDNGLGQRSNFRLNWLSCLLAQNHPYRFSLYQWCHNPYFNNRKESFSVPPTGPSFDRKFFPSFPYCHFGFIY